MLLAVAMIAVTLYFVAAMAQYLQLTGRVVRINTLFSPLGFIAIMLHGVLLYYWIDSTAGQNLNFFNMFSFVVWLIGAVILCAAIRKPLKVLCIFVFPLAAISIFLTLLFPEQTILQTANHPRQLIHILSAAAAFSILCLAAFQGLLLSIQEYLLRRKYAGSIIQHLPPLETMENLLFQMIWLGFILLTMVLLSSVYFFHTLIASPTLLQKTCLAIITWVIFAVLLTGRYLFGWRGRKVTYYTLSGVGLLVIIYFGSQLLLISM